MSQYTVNLSINNKYSSSPDPSGAFVTKSQILSRCLQTTEQVLSNCCTFPRAGRVVTGRLRGWSYDGASFGGRGTQDCPDSV